MTTATAFWIAGPGTVELREETLRPPQEDEAEIETLYSGISRGTERLVFTGKVPPTERERMRCPLQAGELPGPVKYGYAAVGRLVRGSSALEGRDIFCLHPHQDRFTAPADMAILVPESVPAGRAVLGANMETALNIVWDAGILPGDRVAVVGAGAVGLLVAYLAAKVPGTEVTVVDIDPAKAELARRFGCDFAAPGTVPEDRDVVVHASGSSDGLATAISAAGFEARIVEASWFGDRMVEIALGGAFHSRRLTLVSSQVSHVASVRQARRSRSERLALALRLLNDPALDGLISGETPFLELADDYADVLDSPGTLCHRVRYQ